MATNPKSISIKKLLATSLIFAMLLVGGFLPIGNTAKATDNQISFSDLKAGQEGYQAVTSLVSQNIIKGYADGRFVPFASLTREHVAVMLANALNLSKPTDQSTILSSYSDVDTSDRYAWQISAVTKAGIFKGNNGQFNPQKTITREQIATVLVNAFHLKATTADVTFSDYDHISASHRNNVTILAQNGITIGKPDGQGQRLFDGHGPVKRVQFAIFLDKTMKTVKATATATISLALDTTSSVPQGFTVSKDSKMGVAINNSNDYKLLKGFTSNQVNVIRFGSGTSISSDAKPGVYPIKLMAINGATDLANNNTSIKQFDAGTGSAQDYLNGAADGTNGYGMIKIDAQGQASLVDGYQYSVDPSTSVGMMVPNRFPAGHYTFEVDIPNVYGQVLKKQLELDILENSNVDMTLDQTGAVPAGYTEATDATLKKTTNEYLYELTKGSSSQEVSAIKFADTTKFSSNIKSGVYGIKLIGIDGSGDLSKVNSKLLAFNAGMGEAKTYLDSAATGSKAYGMVKIDNQGKATLVDGYQYSLDINTTTGMIIPNGFPAGTYIFELKLTDIYNSPLVTFFAIQVK